MSEWLNASSTSNKLRQTYFQNFVDVSGTISVRNDNNLNLYKNDSSTPEFSINSQEIKIKQDGVYYDVSNNKLIHIKDLSENVQTRLNDLISKTQNITSDTNDTSFNSNVDISGELTVTKQAVLSSSLEVTGSIGVNTNTPAVTIDINATDAIRVPMGTTEQRPVTTDAATHGGYIRYNSENSQFEGYGPGNSWGSLGGVINVAQNTKIISSTPNADSTNNELIFYTAPAGSINSADATERMKISDTGNITIAKDLSISGATTISSILNVSKATTLNSTLNVSDATTLGGTLNVTGKTNLLDDVSMNGDLTIEGDFTVKGNLSVFQTTTNEVIQTHTIVNNYSLEVSEDLSLNGKLKVSDDASLNGELYVDKSTTLGSTLSVTGKTNLNNDVSMNANVDICGNLYAQYPIASIPPTAIEGVGTEDGKVAVSVYTSDEIRFDDDDFVLVKEDDDKIQITPYGIFVSENVIFDDDDGFALFKENPTPKIEQDLSLLGNLSVSGDTILVGSTTVKTLPIETNNNQAASCAYVQNQNYILSSTLMRQFE
tara:strand:+ start:16247 stop:17881 length:1635 start_codon:yes stop_codon:yes gene_type:complete